MSGLVGLGPVLLVMLMDPVDLIDNSLTWYSEPFAGKLLFVFKIYWFITLIILLFSFFSGYIKAHGLKYQTALFPSDMAAGVFGTVANNRDVGALNLSQLTEQLEHILFLNMRCQVDCCQWYMVTLYSNTKTTQQ